jgi:hypothetical protein
MIHVADPMTHAEATALATSVLTLRNAKGSHAAAVDFALAVAETTRRAFERGLASTSPHDLSRLTRLLVRLVCPEGINISAASHIRGEIVTAIAAEQPAPQRAERFEPGRVTGHSERWLWHDRAWLDDAA